LIARQIGNISAKGNMGRKDRPVVQDANPPFIGSSLRQARQARGISLTEMANRLMVSKGHLSGVENNRIQPSAALLQKYEQVLKLEPGAFDIKGKVQPAFSDTDHPSFVWNVPHPRNPFFTGRGNLLDLLHTRLKPGQSLALSQPQAISGLGGVGKTQIAIEYAYRFESTYASIFWVRAASHDSLTADFIALAGLLDLSVKDERSQHHIITMVKNWLKTHAGWLLIFDNADDMLLLKEFLPGKETGSILLTTRVQATGIVAEPIAVETMDEDEGVELLLRRARALAPGGWLEATLPEIRKLASMIVQKLGCLPLAIDQAGAYIEETGCTLKDYLMLYQTHRRSLLKQRGRVVAGHSRSVVSTLELSFQQAQQINPAAAELLHFCAFLAPDSISENLLREGAKHLGTELSSIVSDMFKLNEAISVLRTLSLIRRMPETRSFAIHRLVQVVVRDGMDLQTQKQWAERALHMVNADIPDASWQPIQHLLPHIFACITLINDYQFHTPEAARLLDRAATYWRDCSNYEQAELLYQQALSIEEKILGKDHPLTAQTLDNLAELYQDKGHYEEAEQFFQRALAVEERVLGTDHPLTARTLANLAELYRLEGRYKEAEAFFQRALAIEEKPPGMDDPLTARTLDNLAELYRCMGRYKEAELLARRVLSINERTLGMNHSQTAVSLHNLARIYSTQERYEEAEELYQRSLDIQMKIGNENINVAIVLGSKGLLYYNQGRYEEAKRLFKHSLEIEKRTLDAEHPFTAITLHNLALVHEKEGSYEEAEALHRQALAMKESVLGAEHPSTAASLRSLAVLCKHLHRYEEAGELYQRSLSIWKRVLGPEHPRVIKTQKSYITLLGKIK
jgi:tetratricopeptide (TPR) repeat protein/DNA-binding XRE family transcriptional regulator